MGETEMEPVIAKLREAEALVLSMLNDPAKTPYWDALEMLKVAIWRATDRASEVAICA